MSKNFVTRLEPNLGGLNVKHRRERHFRREVCIIDPARKGAAIRLRLYNTPAMATAHMGIVNPILHWAHA